MKIDLHNHTKYCNHATGEMQEYVLMAIQKKIDIFGFSDHAPMNFDQKYRMNINQAKLYESEIDELRNKYKNEITILKGYEVDYLPNFMEKEVLEANVDYLIGSVHFIKGWGFDNEEFIAKYKEVNIDELWIEYFNQIEKMAKTGLFQIVGHFDLIKVFAFFPKIDITPYIQKTLQCVKESNMAIEINSAGFRKKVKEQYPSIQILQVIKKLEIPITFGSDAHKIEDVGTVFEQCVDIARKVGFKKCAFFEKKKIKLVNF